MSELRPQTIDADVEAGVAIGEYVVERKLGQGGFGAVYRAVHPLIGKVVAIKVLAQRFSVDPDMVERFIAEARAVIQIKHRNIIDIFSFGTLGDGRRYYIMEYLDGEPLDVLLARSHRLSLGSAVPILRAVGRALDAAHAKGIAHRDLKPENVFLGRDEDGNVFPKLLDFGVAKLLHPDDAAKSKTRTGVPIGTPYFMSPEQCRGRDVDHRTDFYAFGVLTYLLLTGVYPIEGEDYMTILMRQMADEPAPPSTVVPELPPSVDALVASLMHKDPAQRPATLAAAVRALEAAAQSVGVAVSPGITSGTHPLEQLQSAHTLPSLEPITDAGSRMPTPVPRHRLVTPLPTEAGVVAGAAVGTLTDEHRVPSKRRSLPLLLALVGAAGLGAAVFLVATNRGGGEAAPGSGARTGSSGAQTGSSGAQTGSSEPRTVAGAVADAGAAAAVVALDVPVVGELTVGDPLPAPTTLTIDGSPSGMAVSLDRKKLGTAPGTLALPATTTPITLRFEKAGYQPQSKQLAPGTTTLTIKLAPVKPRGPREPGDARDKILDPFKR